MKVELTSDEPTTKIHGTYNRKIWNCLFYRVENAILFALCILRVAPEKVFGKFIRSTGYNGISYTIVKFERWTFLELTFAGNSLEMCAMIAVWFLESWGWDFWDRLGDWDRSMFAIFGFGNFENLEIRNFGIFNFLVFLWNLGNW